MVPAIVEVEEGDLVLVDVEVAPIGIAVDQAEGVRVLGEGRQPVQVRFQIAGQVWECGGGVAFGVEEEFIFASGRAFERGG